MEVKNMTYEQTEERLAQINEEMKAEGADLEALKAEVDAIEARRAELNRIAEQRNALADQIANGLSQAKVVKTFTQEGRTMGLKEIRASQEYAQAFLNMIKTNDDSEVRALLSDNVSGGQIPVPTFLETEIKTAWEEHQLMSLVKHSYLKGNVKIGFELSATGASIHVEGAAAPEEEVITIGTVELKAETIKKWITVSDEAIEGTTIDTVGYLYKEIAQKIVEKAEEVLIGKITSAPTSSSATACGVVVSNANPALDTIVNAVSKLSAQAKNLHIAMNRQTYPAFISLQLNANYAVDAFDGLKDRVVFTDKLPAFSAASAGDIYMIIGDFGYGAQANFPNGDNVTIKVDDLSLAEKDLVKLVGKEYVGMGVVAPNAFVNVKKVEEEESA